MAPVLTTALTRLRNDFNTIAPNRDKASDGWIGDRAHSEQTSGHNPDETGGGEYEDADTKDEVRAIDVDTDLRVPGLTMQRSINKILSSPNDLRRLRYIIYNRVIWSKSSGWRPREYTGSNPHDKHGHFSGEPLTDESGEGWSILSLVEEDVAFTEGDKDYIDSQFRRFGAWICAGNANSLMNPDFAPWMTEADAATMASLKAQIAASSAQTIIDGVLAGLPEGVALTKDDVMQALREFYGLAVNPPTP